MNFVVLLIGFWIFFVILSFVWSLLCLSNEKILCHFIWLCYAVLSVYVFVWSRTALKDMTFNNSFDKLVVNRDFRWDGEKKWFIVQLYQCFVGFDFTLGFDFTFYWTIVSIVIFIDFFGLASNKTRSSLRFSNLCK